MKTIRIVHAIKAVSRQLTIDAKATSCKMILKLFFKIDRLKLVARLKHFNKLK